MKGMQPLICFYYSNAGNISSKCLERKTKVQQQKMNALFHPQPRVGESNSTKQVQRVSPSQWKYFQWPKSSKRENYSLGNWTGTRFGKKYNSFVPFLNKVKCYRCENFWHKVSACKSRNKFLFQNATNRVES